MTTGCLLSSTVQLVLYTRHVFIAIFGVSTVSLPFQLANLESLAVYFDTDAHSLAGLPHDEFIEKFTELVRGYLTRIMGARLIFLADLSWEVSS